MPKESKPEIEEPTYVSNFIPVSQLSLAPTVATIAKDATFAVLTATKVNHLGFFGLEFYWRKACAGVTAVAEGLSFA